MGSVSYKLSKWLAKLLSPFVGTISNSFILNSVDLVNKLKSLHINYDYKLVSFDVKSLFTNVPIDDVLNFLPEVIGPEIEGIPVNKIIKLIKLCVEHTTFTFNGKFYSQRFGLPMGNCLSPVLSNIFMEYFETKLLSNIKSSNIVWFRYIDDILCFWPSSEDIDVFLRKLNSLSPTITFTVETENDGCLPFLDVKIIRDQGLLKTKIYRKPTNILSYVHFYSNHHINVKKSVFISMFLRAYKIVDPEFFDEEIKIIMDIGKKLQYPPKVLSQCHETAKKKHYVNAQTIEQNTANKTIVLPFHENFLDIVPTLKKLDVKVAFSYDNTIKSRLIKNSPKGEEGCVYKIPCKGCNSYYVGQTGKDLKTRVKQHKYNVKYCAESSALFQHKFKCDHHIDWDNAVSVIKKKGFDERNIIESCIISKTYNDNLNLSYGHFKCDVVICDLISQRYFPT